MQAVSLLLVLVCLFPLSQLHLETADSREALIFPRFHQIDAVLKSISLEILLSAILAPILMVANTTAVMQTLRGRDLGSSRVSPGPCRSP